MHEPASVIELLQQLIRIPSVNPTGDPGTPRTGEAQIAEALQAFLSGIGAEAELREVLPGRPNVIARFPANRPGKPRLLLAPHTDTVSVSGMTVEPFGGECRDGRVWGRGASDTKGPMAAMLWALAQNREQLADLSHEIWFAGLVGEESGQHGAKALANQEHFDFVIAAEPTSLNAVYTHKGSLWLDLVTRGVAAHAAVPQTGSNAIYKMADVLRVIRDDLVPSFASKTPHPVLGTPTISAGVIHGGSKTNIVPDFCRLEVDIRTVPGLPVLEEVRDRLLAVCTDLEIKYSTSEPMCTDPSHPLIGVLGQCGAKPVSAPWFCDAAVFAAKGCAAVALGPGSIAQAHTEDEWIRVADLESGADFFSRFLNLLRPTD